MDNLIVILVNVGFGLIMGVASAVAKYKDKKAQKKIKKSLETANSRIDTLEAEKNTPQNNIESTSREPIETPSEDGYQRVFNGGMPTITFA